MTQQSFQKYSVSLLPEAENTDIAIILFFLQSGDNILNIIFDSQKLCKVCSTYSFCFILEAKDKLLFVQIWSGFDVVFATYGKASCLRMLNQIIKFKNCFILISNICADEGETGRLSKDL